MAKRNISENWFIGSFKIFFNAIKLYFMNFETFLKIMAFPVIGQLIGVSLIFIVNYFFVIHVPQLAQDTLLFKNLTFVFTFLILLLIPGFLIFAKAFFDYILALASLNLMANHVLSSGQLNDVEIHKDIVKKHLMGYFFLLFILAVLYVILSFPLFWVLLLPIAILFSLTIQAFVLEDDLSPFGAIKRSYLFVRYNFFKTTSVLLLLVLLCYVFLPNVFYWALDQIHVISFCTSGIDLYVNLLPINDINSILAQIPTGIFTLSLEAHKISVMLLQSVVASVIVGFTLPIRAIACTDLYLELRGNNITKDDTQVKKIVKKATEQ